MIWEAIGELLPAAAVIAANPFVVIVVVVLLAGGGLARGGGYLAGWTLGLGVLTAVVVAAADALDADEDPTWLGAARLVIGLALIAAGVRAWIRRPRTPDERSSSPRSSCSSASRSPATESPASDSVDSVPTRDRPPPFLPPEDHGRISVWP